MPRKPYATSPPLLWKKLKPRARRMRRKPTPAEAALWKALRNSALGARFRRQHPVDRFVVDFLCLSRRLVVEVDGTVHNHPRRAQMDRERTVVLNSLGFEVIRFSNKEALTRTDRVLAAIRQVMEARPEHRVPREEAETEA